MGKNTGKKKVPGEKTYAERVSKFTRRQRDVLVAMSILINDKMSIEKPSKIFDIIKATKKKKVSRRKAS